MVYQVEYQVDQANNGSQEMYWEVEVAGMTLTI